jgi:hypothetical protein
VKKIVFVLGAGASAEAGAPVMADFFERAALLSPQSGSGDAFALVAKARAQLQVAQSKSKFDLRNLESVFAAFEMADLLFDELGSLTTEDVRNLGPSIRRVIVATIEKSMRLTLNNSKGRITPHETYAYFGSLIGQLIGAGHDVSILSFNYDVGAELGLLSADVTPLYAVDEPLAVAAAGASGASVALLKLHGSLNWGRCSRCSRVVVRRVHDVVNDQEEEWRRELLPDKGRSFTLQPSGGIGNLRCGTEVCRATACVPDPVIVPPTAYKMDSHRSLQAVWREAAQALRAAEEVFVLGYSWPQSDQFFQQLFSLGSIGPTILSRFWVCNPDPQVRERFREALLGQQALDCFGPTPQEMEPGKAQTFRNAVARIAELYGFSIVGNVPPVLAANRRTAQW